MQRRTILLSLLLALCTSTSAAATISAGYPIEDPLAATIVGTPSQLRAELPHTVPIQVRALPKLVQRPIPEVLEYALPMQYTVSAQEGSAPLVFIIAGTGAGARGTTSTWLTRLLYAAGYHVVALPSPTRVEFMLAAAHHPVPGRTSRDVAALYRVMRTIKRRLSPQLDITGYALTGYSLGALHAAFIAHLDAERQVFDFGPVLLIDPTVDLYRSVRRMDALLAHSLPAGIASLPQLLAQALGQLQQLLNGSGSLKFNQDFLYRAYQAADPSDRETAAIVGLAFRLWLANMSFAADVLTDSGAIVPANVELSITDSLDPYMLRSFSMSFAEYIDQLLLPYYNRGQRHLTLEQLIWEGQLKRIANFLSQAHNIGVIANADDPILSKDGLAFLRTTFGARARIFKNGGHLGNLAYKPVVTVIRRFFRP